jgi:hypothetical protein
MKLAVIGGREFNDYPYLKKILNYIHKKETITFIISGGAKGADKLSEKWAFENDVHKTIYLPDWDTNGKAAGFIRNTDIVKNSDKVLAMWNCKSRGTADSLRKAIQFKKILWVFDYTTKQVLEIEQVKQYLEAIK